jgi:hypothetical protein
MLRLAGADFVVGERFAAVWATGWCWWQTRMPQLDKSIMVTLEVDVKMLVDGLLNVQDTQGWLDQELLLHGARLWPAQRGCSWDM